MKLIFPNGEHEPVSLSEGITTIGTGADCQIVLAAPGIVLHHAEIHLRGGQAMIRVPDPQNVVVLNGRQVTQDMALKPGDLVLFAKVGCQIMAPDRVAATTAPPRAVPGANGSHDDNDGRTRVRQALPKYILRGVSGATFGKTYALIGTMTVGRQADCDISIPGEEISRHHVKLQVTPDGVMIEDMGSANGTFVNDKRVHSGVLKPGEELRLDTVRFMLMAPGMEPQKTTLQSQRPELPPPSSGTNPAVWIAVLVGALVVAVGAAKFLGWF